MNWRRSTAGSTLASSTSQRSGCPFSTNPRTHVLQRYEFAHSKAWSASVDAADAFLFVLPEYNFGPPGALVNAMNYLVREWHYKPLGFVSYGGVSGGIRAVQVTKQLLTTLKVVPLLEAVSIVNVAQRLDAAQKFVAEDVHRTSGTAMLDELSRWTKALQVLRYPQQRSRLHADCKQD